MHQTVVATMMGVSANVKPSFLLPTKMDEASRDPCRRQKTENKDRRKPFHGAHRSRAGIKYQQKNDNYGSLDFLITEDNRKTLTFLAYLKLVLS